nr:733_t:CDS:2 [Entrophospora candida]
MNQMDIFGTCCNLLGCISTVANEVHNICKNAKDNREKYERISQRIETTTSQLRTLYVRLLNGDKNFNPNNVHFVDNLQRYLNSVTEIRNTVKKYDKLKKKSFWQLVNANKYSDKIKNLEKRYERALGDLDFTINMENYKSIENLGNQVQDLNDTVRKESELLLKTVEDGFKKLTENSKNLDPQSKMIAKEAHKKFENNYEEISQHILNKKREDLNFDYKHSSDIQQCFKEIISTAWKHEPGERLKLPDILTKLETLYNKYYVSCEESSTEAISKNSIPLEQENYKSIENLGNQVQDLNDTVRKSKMIAKEAHKVNKGEFKISLSYDELQEKDLTDPNQIAFLSI